MVPVWPPGPGGCPVISLHGAVDRLDNESVDLLWAVVDSAERMRMDWIVECRVRRRTSQQIREEKRLGPGNLNAIDASRAGDGSKVTSLQPIANDLN